MVCADTNCWIAFFGGQQGRDVQILKQCLISHSLDYEVWFMSRDRDFSPFTKHAGLSLLQ